MNIFELHDEILRRETELAELRFQLELVVSVIEYTKGDKYMSKKCICSRDGVPSGYYWHDPACPVHNKSEGDRVGRAGLESSDCSAVTSKRTNNNQG